MPPISEQAEHAEEASAYGDLGSLGLVGMVRLSSALRALAADRPSVADFAQAVCRHLHDHLVDESGTRQTVLVRFYATAQFATLPMAERDTVPGALADETTCLVLLGTVGNEPAWNSRTRSVGHRVIPLADVAAVERLPMVAALLDQLGIHLPALMASSGHLVPSTEAGQCGVFHVPRAQYSPLIPAQDFVAEHGVESVLGFGGALPTGEVYAVVLFADIPVPLEAATLFETVALSTTLAAMDLLDLPLLQGAARQVPRRLTAREHGAAREGVAAALLRVHERVAVAEAEASTRSLERITIEAQRYAALAARLRLAQDAAQLGLWEFVPESGQLIWDDHCTSLFGAEADELTGLLDDLEQRCHPEDLPSVRRQLQQALNDGGDMDMEYRVVLPDGSFRRHLSRGHSVSDHRHRVVRVIGAVLDVTELRSAADLRSRLTSVSLRLASASTVSQVNDIVIDDGFAALGAAGGAILMWAADGVSLEATMTGFYEEGVQRLGAVVPPDMDMPSVSSAIMGETFIFESLDQLLASFPGQRELLLAARTEASVSLPLRIRGRLLGSLTATWTGPRTFSAVDLEVIESLAAQCAQALDRVLAEESERRSVAAVRSMSEALQRSMLTSPPDLPGLEIVVRYRPAALELEIGGDWYDAFISRLGDLCLVVGDVTGHDREAAATMGQVRNLLRAAAYASPDGPVTAFETLERTMDGLQVSALATVILAELGPAAHDGSRSLLWCNAGHLPPLLVIPGRGAELLEREPDLVLGMIVGTPRAGHAIAVPPGATLLLFTDGLVERRGEHLDEGLSRLVAVAGELADLPPGELCDALLSRLVPDGAEDDVALLAVRVRAV